MLRKVDVQIGRSLRLLTVVAQGSGAPRRCDKSEHLAGGVVHRVSDYESAPLRRPLHVRRVSIDLSRRVVKDVSHPLHVGDGLAESGENKISRRGVESFHEVLHQSNCSSVPARGNPDTSEPEPRAFEIEPWCSHLPVDRYERSPEFKSLALRICHTDGDPRVGKSTGDLVGDGDVEQSIPVSALSRH